MSSVIEVSSFQGAKIYVSMNWDLVKCPDYLSVLNEGRRWGGEGGEGRGGCKTDDIPL